jgi:hypothetical protein
MEQEEYWGPDVSGQGSSDLSERRTPTRLEYSNIASFIRKSQPDLCTYCLNVASVFSDPSITPRSTGKAALSTITFHQTISQLHTCSDGCPLCLLISNLFPLTEEQKLWDLIKAIVTDRKSITADEGLREVREWAKFMTSVLGTREGLGRKGKAYKRWERSYKRIAGPFGNTARFIEPVDIIKIFQERPRPKSGHFSISIRETYGSGKDISGFYLETQGIRDEIQGNLRVCAPSGKHNFPSSIVVFGFSLWSAITCTRTMAVINLELTGSSP